MFTNEELRFIERAVGDYLHHDDVREIKTSIIHKIRNNYAVHDVYRRFTGLTQKLEGNKNIQVAILGELDTPMFRFIKCSNDIEVKKLFPPGIYTYQNLAFNYSNNNFLTISNSVNAYNKVSISLNRYESEVLLAFLLYFKMAEKGIDASGLKPETTKTEETETTED